MLRQTTLTIKILSDGRDIADWDIVDVLRECDEGDLVLAGVRYGSRALSGREMAAALIEAGSDPSFFNLNPDGTQAED